MSGLVNLTPTLRVAIRNPLLDKAYPPEGVALAVIDTGYEGFMALPRDVFELLSLHTLQLQKRVLVLANGARLTAEGAYCTLSVPDIAVNVDGFVETYEGLDEILLGTEALTNFRVLLDYCSKRLRVERCP